MWLSSLQPARTHNQKSIVRDFILNHFILKVHWLWRQMVKTTQGITCTIQNKPVGFRWRAPFFSCKKMYFCTRPHVFPSMHQAHNSLLSTKIEMNTVLPGLFKHTPFRIPPELPSYLGAQTTEVYLGWQTFSWACSIWAVCSSTCTLKGVFILFKVHVRYSGRKCLLCSL